MLTSNTVLYHQAVSTCTLEIRPFSSPSIAAAIKQSTATSCYFKYGCHKGSLCAHAGLTIQNGLYLLKHHKAKLTAVIISHISYYSLCLCFSWNVPCRLTWQSKRNNTFRFQALSFPCWRGKKTQFNPFLSGPL